MKQLHATFTLLFVMILVMSPMTGVSGQSGFKSEQFQEEKIAFFNEKLSLSDEQANQFWPVYKDLHNRRMKINQDEKSLLDYYQTNSQYMSDEEVSESLAKYRDLQEKRKNLESEYHKKLLDVLGERKVMMLYTMEREFRLHLLRKFQHRNRQGRGGGRR